MTFSLPRPFTATFRLLLAAGALAWTGPAGAQPASAPVAAADLATWDVPLIPRTVLFGNPERANPRLSPDGRRMAYLAPLNGVQNVWVGPVGGAARPVTRDTGRGIHRYRFAQDDRHLLYLQDRDGNENWRLYGLDLETDAVKDYTPYDDVQVRIVGTARRVPGAILIAINKDDARHHDVYRLELESGALSLVAKNPGGIIEWTMDPDLRVLGAVRLTADGGQELLVRAAEDAPWTPRVRWSMEDSAMSGPVAFTAGGRALILKDSRGADTTRLVRLDLASDEAAVLAHDETYDMGRILRHPDTFEPQAAGVTRERPEWIVLDDALRADFARMRAIAPGTLYIAGRTPGDRWWLLTFRRAAGSSVSYLYDARSGAATKLFEHQPALNQYPLAPMESVTIPARDGLTLHGYITFPVGLPRNNLPLVLNVHGGPWSRNAWGYHSTAQWLANRGYICLQVNFRGSSGYGKAFLNAGNREWAGAMHDDLVDAVRWAVAQGYADADRIAILGASYGGYAALVGAAFTPDLFACAVDLVGPSNLVTLLQSIPPYWEPLRALWTTRVGDPEADAAFLLSRSPLSKVDQITIPILIAQGANDPRVKQAESDQIVAALKQRGIPHEYLLFPDEGHGLAKPENRLRFRAAAERFLARYLGGRYELEGDGAPAN